MTSTRPLLRLILPLLFSWPCLAGVQAPVETARIDVLEPAAGVVPAGDVVGGKLEAGFAPAPNGWLRAPDEREAWYRVRIAAGRQAVDPLVLAISGDTRARVTAYLPPDYRARALSPYAADADPRFSRHAMVLELPPGLSAQDAVYLRVGAPGQSQPMRARVVDYSAYQMEDLHHVRIAVFFASVEMAMLMVILCFWWVLRDRVFLYFLGYVSAQLAYQLAVTGELYALPGADLLAPLGYHPGQFAAIVSAGLSVSFILDFAELRRYVPRLARFLAATRWPYLGLAIALWLPPLAPDRWLPSAVNLMLVLTTLTALVAAWLAWRRGSRQAGFFLISWLPLLCLTVLRVAQLLVGLPLPAWLEYGFPASMAYAAVVIAVGLADRTLQARRERDLAHRLAEFDPLTGVLNRRAILSRLRVAYADARQAQRALVVLFLDLDHFKRVNDDHGHAAGDRVLAAVAGAMQGELRDVDWLGRYGGEEFLVVLPDTAELAARTLAERLRARVAELRVEGDGTQVRPTVSIGMARLEGSTSNAEALVEHADRALYSAKAQGRNRVVQFVAPSGTDAPGAARRA